MEADGELSHYEEFVHTVVKDKGKKKVDKEKEDEGPEQGGMKEAEKKQEEETDTDDEYDPHVDDDTVNEPNFIWNENKETSCGKCYFKALKDDMFFGNGKTIHYPFYRNVDGFILKRHPRKGQNQVYIPDGRCKIDGEFYSIRTLLIHSAHLGLGPQGDWKRCE